jgi:hypothetical protein
MLIMGFRNIPAGDSDGPGIDFDSANSYHCRGKYESVARPAEGPHYNENKHF